METPPRPHQAPKGTDVGCQKCNARITLPRADEITGRSKYQTRNGGVTPCRNCGRLFHTRCLAEQAEGSRGQFSTCTQHEHEDAVLVVLLSREGVDEEQKGGDDESDAAPPSARLSENEDEEYITDDDATEAEYVETAVGFAPPATRARTRDREDDTDSVNTEQSHAKRQKKASRESSASQQMRAATPSDQAASGRQAQLKSEQLKTDRQKKLFVEVVDVAKTQFSNATPECVMKVYNVHANQAKPPLPKISEASVVEQANAFGIELARRDPMSRGRAPARTAGPGGHHPWCPEEDAIVDRFLDKPKHEDKKNYEEFIAAVAGTEHDYGRTFGAFQQHLAKRRTHAKSGQ